MKSRYRRILGSILLFTLVAAATQAAAVNLPFKAFFGTYGGTGISRTDADAFFGLTVRDLDVTIQPAKNGFTIVWTTVTREHGEPDNPRVKRSSSALTFAKTKRASIFRATTSKDPLSGAPYSWARIDGQTLTVYQMVIADNGTYAMHVYDRTLTGSGMELKFTRVVDGQPVRSVSGKLTRRK